MCCVHIFTKLNNENANKNENAAKKQKVITPEVKFKSNVNGIMEEVADCGNADTSPIPWELQGSKPSDIREEGGAGA